MFKPAFADLSHHNTISDSGWAQAKASGLIGVILKATEGTSYVDNTYAERVKKARAAGLAVASYHYLKASADNAAQMRHFVDVVQPAAGERMVIDFEEEGLDGNDLEDALSELMHLVPECQFTVYGGQSFLMEKLGKMSGSTLLAETSLWVARYTSADDPGEMPPAWPTWTAWQYTDGQVGGSPKAVDGFGKCDLNAFNGSAENCALWFEPAPQPQPEPGPEPEPAEVTITTKGSVRVTVNGQVVTYE